MGRALAAINLDGLFHIGHIDPACRFLAGTTLTADDFYGTIQLVIITHQFQFDFGHHLGTQIH